MLKIKNKILFYLQNAIFYKTKCITMISEYFMIFKLDCSCPKNVQNACRTFCATSIKLTLIQH